MTERCDRCDTKIRRGEEYVAVVWQVERTRLRTAVQEAETVAINCMDCAPSADALARSLSEMRARR